MGDRGSVGEARAPLGRTLAGAPMTMDQLAAASAAGKAVYQGLLAAGYDEVVAVEGARAAMLALPN